GCRATQSGAGGAGVSRRISGRTQPGTVERPALAGESVLSDARRSRDGLDPTADDRGAAADVGRVGGATEAGAGGRGGGRAVCWQPDADDHPSDRRTAAGGVWQSDTDDCAVAGSPDTPSHAALGPPAAPPGVAGAG